MPSRGVFATTKTTMEPPIHVACQDTCTNNLSFGGLITEYSPRGRMLHTPLRGWEQKRGFKKSGCIGTAHNHPRHHTAAHAWFRHGHGSIDGASESSKKTGIREEDDNLQITSQRTPRNSLALVDQSSIEPRRGEMIRVDYGRQGRSILSRGLEMYLPVWC